VDIAIANDIIFTIPSNKMGASLTSADADEYINQDELDAQFCVECKHSLETQKQATKAAIAERDIFKAKNGQLNQDLTELQTELNNTTTYLNQCNAGKESFTSSGGSNTFLWVVISLIAGIILGLFIAKRYSYVLDRKLGDILKTNKDSSDT
jgi:hypothetical protein